MKLKKLRHKIKFGFFARREMPFIDKVSKLNTMRSNGQINDMEYVKMVQLTTGLERIMGRIENDHN